MMTDLVSAAPIPDFGTETAPTFLIWTNFFAIQTNTFHNFNTFILVALLDKKRVLAPGVCSHVANTTLGEDSQGNGLSNKQNAQQNNFQNIKMI